MIPAEIRSVVLVVLLAAAGLVPSASHAQTRLPPGAPDPVVAKPTSTAVPALAAVPVPAARPRRPGEAAPPVLESSKGDGRGSGKARASDAAEEVILPNSRKSSVPFAGGTGTLRPGADAAAQSVAPEKPEGPGRGTRSSPDPERLAGPGRAPPPVAEIPVPESRPADISSPAAPRVTVPAPGPLPASPPVPPADSAPPEETRKSPDDRDAPVPSISPAAAVLAAAAVADAERCEDILKKRGIAFSVGKSISAGGCGVLRPVNVSRLASGVAVSPATEMLCGTAIAFDDWMTKVAAPAATDAFPGDRLSAVRHASTYVCRQRASEKGISEHARGSAIDIVTFVLAGGREIRVEAKPPGTPEARFQAAARSGACGPFKTVLGPGTDADHATHFHLDIAARRNGSTYCK